MGVCLRYCHNRDEAKAALNLTYYKILRKLDTYRPEVPLDAWMRRIAINTLIDEYRKQRKGKDLIETTAFEGKNTYKTPITHNDAEYRADAAQLEALVQQLPNMTRKVFNLFAIDGYAHLEIADMLGISEGTSKWHVNSARKKLQLALTALRKRDTKPHA